MTKKEWQEHCKWLDTFRGKTISSYDEYGKKKKKPKKKNG
jgi:hypothetical protein